MDRGNFALLNGAATIAWQRPGIPPPSFIYALNELWPPYDASVEITEPSNGCSSQEAALCAVKHSIRLVSKARTFACPELEAGGVRREEALLNISAGNYSKLAFAAQGFEVFVLDEDLQIIADGLRPDLVGTGLADFNASAAVWMPWLKDYVGWVTDWGGGFVPHFSMRLQEDSRSMEPDGVATYVEKCPWSGDYLAVSFSRSQSETAASCRDTSNAYCSWRNVESLVGKMLVEFLVSSQQETVSNVWYDHNYPEEDSGFYGVMAQMTWYGYPGPNDLWNPAPVPNGMNTFVIDGNAINLLGRNITDTMGTYMEDYERSVSYHMGRAAWTGGAVEHYTWGLSHKVVLVAGLVWNNTAYYMMAGTEHSPEATQSGPLCASCDANYSWTCSVVNAWSLAAHARMQMLIPDTNWTELTNNPWFGASHAAAADNEYSSTWPSGFYVRAFDLETSLCVADGNDPSNIGKSAAEIFGNSDAHERFSDAAVYRGNWIAYQDQGSDRLAMVRGVPWGSRNYYIVSAFTKVRAPMSEVDDCSSSFSEECSTWNAEAALGHAIAELLSQTDEDSLAEVVRSIEEGTGLFSPEEVGDFQVHVYDGDFGCWSGSEERGFPCPPDLSKDFIDDAQSALGSGQVASVTGLYDGQLQAAFVYYMPWTPAGSLSIQDFNVMITVLGEAAAPVCSSDSDCPAHASCSSGRCACDTNYLENMTVIESDCGGYAVTEMTCVNVEAMDCTSSSSSSSVIDLSACESCRAGYFCRNGKRTICPRGQYCPANQSHPFPCPEGQYSKWFGAVECNLCAAGTAAPSAGSTKCVECQNGTYAGSAGQEACTLCPVGSYSELGAESCTLCPGESYTASTGATSIDDCRHCPEGQFLSGHTCRKCRWGFQAKNEDATSCVLAPMAQVLACGLIGGIALITFVVCWLRRLYKQRLLALKTKANAASEAFLADAIQCSSEFGHPMSLMNAGIFLELNFQDINLLHAGNRNAHRLVSIDTMDHFKGFQADGNHVIFLSYQSLSASKMGIGKTQLAKMQAAIVEVIDLKGWSWDTTFLWLDVISVPQEPKEARQLAVDSLYVYAKCADIFLAVHPRLRHETGAVINSDTYRERAWSRAEVLSFCCGSGPGQVYCCGDNGVEPTSLQTLISMANVFEGKFCCCEQGHHRRGVAQCNCTSLIQPMSGLYYDNIQGSLVTALNKAPPQGVRFFQEHVLPYKEVIFPRTFRYKQHASKGRVHEEVRELFGTLLQRIDRRRASRTMGTLLGSISSLKSGDPGPATSAPCIVVAPVAAEPESDWNDHFAEKTNTVRL